jgi:hypothetical protein
VRASYSRDTAKQNCFPAGASDDQGLYLYLPYVARLTGMLEPQRALKWAFITCLATLVGVYPLAIRGLFGSVLAALVLPLAGLFGGGDIYWVSA